MGACNADSCVGVESPIIREMRLAAGLHHLNGPGHGGPAIRCARLLEQHRDMHWLLQDAYTVAAAPLQLCNCTCKGTWMHCPKADVQLTSQASL
jgi:hypothetical protein